MEWWAIFLMVIVLLAVSVFIFYFVLKIYFPYHFATFSYHINTKGEYASNKPTTLTTFRSKSDGDIIFTETGCFAKANLASNKSLHSTSKDNLPLITESTFLLDNTSSKLGQIQVGLDVDYDTSELIVLVIAGKDFNFPDNETEKHNIEETDFYICVDLMDNEEVLSSSKTKVHEKEKDPNFKERFLFKLDVTELSRKSLRFRLVAIVKSDKHVEMSKAVLQINDVNVNKAKRLWLNLKEMNAEEDGRGEFMLSLTYLPTASRITLVIIKAKDLKWKIPKQRSGDVMISVSLIKDGRRICKRQTSVKRKARDPIFNESLIFSVTDPNDNLFLRLTVSEILPTGRMYTIGHCVLGPTSSGSELTHWQQMVSNPRRPSAMWHWIRKATKKIKSTTKKVDGKASYTGTSESDPGAPTSDTSPHELDNEFIRI